MQQPPVALALPAETNDRATLASWYGLAVLTLVTLFATVDRQVFILLAGPIKAELALSDFQLGLLQGVGLVIFSTIASFPIAWAADRYDRRIIMSGCILVWSLAVAACGLAQGFNQLFLASAFVGAGAAGLGPIIYSLIPELFRGNQRQTANSVFTVATAVGGGIAIALCGYIILAAGALQPALSSALGALPTWRLSFLLAAAPAPLFIVLMLLMRIPRRQALRRVAEPGAAHPAATDSVALGIFIAAHRASFASFIIGVGLVAIAAGATGVWLPQVAIRQFGATTTEVGSLFGLAGIVAALAGLGISVFGTRWLRPRFGPRLPIIVLFIASIAAAISIVATWFATSTGALAIGYGLYLTCILSGSMVYPTAMQDMAPTHLRARITALNGIASFVFGAIGAPLIGAISDGMADRPEGLLIAIIGAVSLSMLSCAGLMLVCSRTFVATVDAAARIDAGAAA